MTVGEQRETAAKEDGIPGNEALLTDEREIEYDDG